MKTVSGLVICLLLGSIALCQKPSRPDMEKNAKQAYKMLLKETDKNKDGKISRTEFNAVWKDQKVAEKNWKAWDTNKDGFILEDEYVKAVAEIGKKMK